jgi:transcriptional regulator with XRE-family HTH domain
MRMMTGKKIKELRQQKGFTPRRLAELMNITTEDLKQIEAGKIPVTDELLRDFADALRSRPDVIMDYNTKPQILFNTVETEQGKKVYLITNGMKCSDVVISEQGSVVVTFHKDNK